eukprot:15455816-Alexandrium_andersonii.AAC.1
MADLAETEFLGRLQVVRPGTSAFGYGFPGDTLDSSSLAIALPRHPCIFTDEVLGDLAVSLRQVTAYVTSAA